LGSIWIKDFNGGLDTRRLPETTAGGVLLVARDGHISRGGEFEQRAAFVPEYELPAGTVGLFYTNTNLLVFGSGPEPALPTGVVYQRLRHPDNTTELVGVPSADLYQGKVYAVGEFADGSVYHYYDGARVPDWSDGRASATITVVSGTGTINNVRVAGVALIAAGVPWNATPEDTATDLAAAINAHTSSPDYTAAANGRQVIIRSVTPGSAANGRVVAVNATNVVVNINDDTMSGGYEPIRAPSEFAITGGGTGSGSKATGVFDVETTVGGRAFGVSVNGVEIMGGMVQSFDGNDTSFAAAIAAQINSNTSSPDYTATSSGNRVTIKTATNTASVNGKAITGVFGTGATIHPVSSMSGGAVAYNSRVMDMKVDGVSIISAPVAWAGSKAATASALAAAINSHTSSPDYSATVSGAKISLSAVVPASVPDGASVVFTMADGMTVSPSTFKLLNAPVVYLPGDFVKTVKGKMYATAGSVMHFSGIKAPTKWTTATVGAGFIDMSEESSGSEDLTSLARYQNMVAVFAERVIQIWFVDPDPALNRQSQVLNNTGTASPRSVVSFGDTDIFYLDESGLRSLRARDSSNAAATTDIGVPVDDLVLAQLATLTTAERRRIFGLIEPVDGRFWLLMRDRAFVFSYFPGSKISAWSEYRMTYVNEGDETEPFLADEAVVFRRRVCVRSGDRIFVYSGLAGNVHDATVAEAELPYLDAGSPAEAKQFTGVDVAMRGMWEVSAAMNTINMTAEDKVGIVFRTSFDEGGRIPLAHRATHVSLRFRSQGVGPHKLASCVLHFEGGGEND
jgi:hypothetical protein